MHLLGDLSGVLSALFFNLLVHVRVKAMHLRCILTRRKHSFSQSEVCKRRNKQVVFAYAVTQIIHVGNGFDLIFLERASSHMLPFGAMPADLGGGPVGAVGGDSSRSLAGAEADSRVRGEQ